MKKINLYSVARVITKFLFKLFFRPKYIGLENIPKEGKIILAGNHTSNFDCIYLMSSTKRQIHFLAKKELWQGIKKIIFSNMGLIPVDRKNKNPNALKSAINCLNNNEVIGIFPEGTISRDSGLLPFKIGAVKMAYETNSQIVPFIITGKYKFFSNNLRIEFLKPISIVNDNLDIENGKLKDIINSKLGG